MAYDAKTGELWGLFMAERNTLGRIDIETGAVTYDILFDDTLAFMEDANAYNR